MFDRFLLEFFLKWKLSIESFFLNYVVKVVIKNVIVVVDIFYLLIKVWYEFLGLQKKVRKIVVVVSQFNQLVLISSDLSFVVVQEYIYVDFFEYCIFYYIFVIIVDE